MERKLATIAEIESIHPIVDADNIEMARIRGWQVVVKKGQFQPGQLCVYCEVDSVMPEWPEFEFLSNRNYRIKTAKLRGQISQGIAFPMSILDGKINYSDIGTIIDTDVTEALGITKYDPPIPACLGGTAKGRFPSHSIKTDEERIQNLKAKFEEYKQSRWYVTEKLDGSSMTCFIYDNEFGIASRNLTLKEHPENELNSFWKVAREIQLEEKMKLFMDHNNLEAFTLQGELIGEGIQKNKYKLKGQHVRFFRAFDPIKYEFFTYHYFMVMMLDMGLETVPIIETKFELPDTYEELVAYADGRSALADTAREGLVFIKNGSAERFQGRESFKIISNKFLLKHGE